MATQQDDWTLWYNWQAAPDVARDLRHTGDFANHAFDRALYSPLKSNIVADITKARACADDPASRAMVIHMTNAVTWVWGLADVLLYALYDTRQLAGDGGLTKEEVFDLWLERAGEMTL